jgi:hypothetical protein
MTDNNHRSSSLELQQGLQEELSKLMADLAETRRIANARGRPLCRFEWRDVVIAIGLLTGGTFIIVGMALFFLMAFRTVGNGAL